MTKETNPLGKTKTYIYNHNKQIAGVVDEKAQMTVYAYDALGRLKNKATNDDTFTYTYDALGRLTTAKNNTSDLVFTYDTKGNLISEKDNAKNTQITYTYDNYGNRTTMTGPMGTTTYTYDNFNRLTTITDPNNKTIKYTLDTLGKKTKEELPNNTTTNYQYDQLNQITQIQTQNSNNQTINSNIYTYDSVGNKITKQDSSGTHNYSYDNTYQLINAAHTNQQTETYAYDSVGNRNPSTYKHSAWNQILEDDKYTYTYDDNGNRTQRTAKDGILKDVYTWNAENKLVKLETYDSVNAATPVTTSTYKYDALGRRIEKAINKCSSPETCVLSAVSYLYDGINIIAEMDANNTITTTYTHGNNIDEPLSMEKNGQTYYYHKDALGNITSITDSSGTVVQKYEYDSFGNIISMQDPNFVQPFTFTGREYDSESNTYHYRLRTYDPYTGTFISADPIGFAGGDVNLYRYVKNSPVNFVDPLGLSETTGCPKKSCWDQYWEEFERNRVPGASLFGLPTGFISGSLTALLTAGPVVAEKAAQNAAIGAFESQKLTGSSIYVKNYFPRFFSWGTAARVVGKISLIVTVGYVSADVTTLIYTGITFDCKK